MSSSPPKPRILMVENLDRYFITHRLVLAKAIQAAGYEVIAASGGSEYAERIRAEGFQFHPLPLYREGTNPRDDLRLMGALRRLYAQVQPTVVHQFNIKPVTYGTLVSRTLGLPVLNTITGLGTTFAQPGLLTTLIKNLYRVSLSYSNCMVTFQNPDDRREFIDLGLVDEAKTVLVLGSGVDVDRFRFIPETETPPVVMFAARLMRNKGVEDFITVARHFKAQNADVRFVLVGVPDPDNRLSISTAEIEGWVAEKLVEWWGYQSNMPEVLGRAAIIMLPSIYREGIPKILIEAAAVGRPIVTYDMPGCHEVVNHEVNGLLVPPGDVDGLIAATQRLLDDPALRQRYGHTGRQRAVDEFSAERVNGKFLQFYAQLSKR